MNNSEQIIKNAGIKSMPVKNWVNFTHSLVCVSMSNYRFGEIGGYVQILNKRSKNVEQELPFVLFCFTEKRFGLSSNTRN